MLELEPTEADGIRLWKRYWELREQLLVFMSDREVLMTKNVSEQALQLSATLRKVTNRFRLEWRAELYGRWWAWATDRGPRCWPRCTRRWREAAPGCRLRPLPPNDRPSRYSPSVDFRG